jgi:hypothetical protein
MNIIFPKKAMAQTEVSSLTSRLIALSQRWFPLLTEATAATTADLAAIRVDVTALDIGSPVSVIAPVVNPQSGQVVTVDLDVTVGANRVFVVSGLDRARNPIFLGRSDPITLTEGQPASVTVNLSDIPFVTTLSPANGQVDVPVDSTIQFTFSKLMNRSTLTSTAFVIMGPNAPNVANVASTDVSCTNITQCTVATLTLTSPLAAGETYRILIQTGITDLQGNPLSLALPGVVFPTTFTTVLPTTGGISGTVINLANNAPIPNASALIIGTALSATTNTQGNFTINGASPGDRSLSISASGFLSETITVPVTAGQTFPAGRIGLQPASDNNFLSSLRPSVGTLSPNFDPQIVSYLVAFECVEGCPSDTTITAVLSDPSTARLTINGANANSGVASGAIPLNQPTFCEVFGQNPVGSTLINVEVTAQNGSTRLYSLTVTLSRNCDFLGLG